MLIYAGLGSASVLLLFFVVDPPGAAGPSVLARLRKSDLSGIRTLTNTVVLALRMCSMGLPLRPCLALSSALPTHSWIPQPSV